MGKTKIGGKVEISGEALIEYATLAIIAVKLKAVGEGINLDVKPWLKRSNSRIWW